MFHSKSRTAQLQETLQQTLQENKASLASSAAVVAEQVRGRVAPVVGQAAGSAVEWGHPHVQAARHWAKPRLEHGIEVAAPKLESVVSGLAPKVETARDKIVEDLIPRLTEAVAAFSATSVAAKNEAVSRGTGAAAVISGDAVASKHKKKGRVMLFLALFAAAVAGAAAFMMKRSAPKDDPWATPVSDPYVAPSPGRHSSVAPVGGTTDAADSSEEAAAADQDPADPDAGPSTFDPQNPTDMQGLDPAEKADSVAKHGKNPRP